MSRHFINLTRRPERHGFCSVHYQHYQEDAVSEGSPLLLGKNITPYKEDCGYGKS